MSINKLRPLPPFKLQVLTNFPFIDADFEALTNWELYCKLVEYLNKVIVPSENELIDAFNNLKDYIDEYFENLDVQEEVNNKLDEMSLDGTLETLLTPIVNGILTDEKLTEIIEGIIGESLGKQIKIAPNGVCIDFYHGGITSDNNRLTSIINEQFQKNDFNFLLYMCDDNSNFSHRTIFNCRIYEDIEDLEYHYKAEFSQYIDNSLLSEYLKISDYMQYNKAISNLTIVNNEVVDVADADFFDIRNVFLPTNNTTNYEPVGDYNPSTKKYVDDNVLKFDSMPVASDDYLGKVVQFIGATDSNYTKGYFYECVSDGATPPVYSWSEIIFGSSDVNTNYDDIILPSGFINEFRDFSSYYYYSIRIDTSTSSSLLSNLINAINDLITNNIDAKIYKMYSNYNTKTLSWGNSYITLYKATDVTDGQHYVYYDLELDALSFMKNTYRNFKLDNNREIQNGGSILCTFSGGVITSIDSLTQISTERYIPFTSNAITMPTANNNYLGNIVQYIGATDSNYTKGHFYECVNNGGTYSWEEISFGGSTQAIPIYNMPSTEYLDFSPNSNNAVAKSTNFKTNLQTIASNMVANDIYQSIINIRNSSSSSTSMSPFYCYITNSSIYLQPIINTNNLINLNIRLAYGLPSVTQQFGYSVTLNTSTKTITLNTEQSSTTSTYFLSCTNNAQYVPTNDYNPATKKYVDDKPTTYTGYDATKTQVLKNVNGTLTWIDET